VAVAVVAAFAGGYLVRSGDIAVPHANAAAQSAPAAQSALVRSGVPDFASIAEAYGPAVVNISVTANARPASLTSEPAPGGEGDPIQEFFRRFGPGFAQPPQGGAIRRGEGSGFIVSPDGMVLTNAHVVSGADEVIVKLIDRREFRAKVLGVDKQTDIAVLRIDAKNLPTVKLGDPAQTRVGDWVLAIGSPFGFENSVTAGIVSAKSRALPDGTYVPFIQTDAAVNPGNSGGPLFNLKGEVIGINSQIYSGTGGYQGLAFAIPIDVASKVQSQLVAHGKVTRGRLGVTIQQVNQALAASFGLDKPQGALVSSVEAGSPAAQAGIKAGDVILSIDGNEIRNSTDLPAAVADKQPGSRARLSVVRKGERLDIAVNVGQAPEGKRASAQSEGKPQGRLGLAVRALSAEERRAIGTQGGLVVEESTGAAAKAGIQPGDVILAINGAPVSNVEQLRALTAKAGKNVALLVQRADAKIFVPVELG